MEALFFSQFFPLFLCEFFLCAAMASAPLGAPPPKPWGRWSGGAFGKGGWTGVPWQPDASGIDFSQCQIGFHWRPKGFFRSHRQRNPWRTRIKRNPHTCRPHKGRFQGLVSGGTRVFTRSRDPEYRNGTSHWARRTVVFTRIIQEK